MRGFLAVFLLILPLWSLDWMHNWEAAVSASKKSGRPILVVMMRPDCPYCRKLSAETLSNTAIESAVENGFVPLYLDTYEHGAEIAKSGLTAQGVPASFVIDPAGNLKGRLMGYQPPMVYMGFLQQHR